MHAAIFHILSGIGALAYMALVIVLALLIPDATLPADRRCLRDAAIVLALIGAVVAWGIFIAAAIEAMT
jgi:hypothetical protein